MVTICSVLNKSLVFLQQIFNFFRDSLYDSSRLDLLDTRYVFKSSVTRSSSSNDSWNASKCKISIARAKSWWTLLLLLYPFPDKNDVRYPFSIMTFIEQVWTSWFCNVFPNDTKKFLYERHLMLQKHYQRLVLLSSVFLTPSLQ